MLRIEFRGPRLVGHRIAALVGKRPVDGNGGVAEVVSIENALLSGVHVPHESERKSLQNWPVIRSITAARHRRDNTKSASSQER